MSFSIVFISTLTEKQISLSIDVAVLIYTMYIQLLGILSKICIS